MRKTLFKTVGFVVYVIFTAFLVCLPVPLWVQLVISVLYGISMGIWYACGKEGSHD